MKSKINIFTVLSLLNFLSCLCLIAGVIVWIWAGWSYGWRTGLSGIVGLLGFSGLGNAYDAITPKPVAHVAN